MKKVLIIILVILITGSSYFFLKNNNVDKLNLSESEISSLNSAPVFYESESQKTAVNNVIEQYSADIGKNKTGYADYYLYVSIAQQYMLLGEGENAMKYFYLAIKDDPERSLPYSKAAGLLARAGLLDLAEQNYEKVVEVEPQSTNNYLELLDFLIKYRSNNTSKIQSYYTKARLETVDDVKILRSYAQWLASEKEYVRAIDILKFVLMQQPEEKEEISAEIQKLTKLVS